MSEDALQGGCLCGAVRYRITGPTPDVSHCHCSMCRKAAGAAYMTFACVDGDQLRWTSPPPKSYQSSDFARRTFCPTCGTALTYWSEKAPGRIDISAASLDDPNAVTPDRHIFLDDAISWARPGQDDLAHYGQGTPEAHQFDKK